MLALDSLTPDAKAKDVTMLLLKFCIFLTQGPAPGRHEWVGPFPQSPSPVARGGSVASVFPDVLPPEGAAPRGALA
eukprot:scaffold35954_cov157-Isochrysis_galbana.AAC.2